MLDGRGFGEETFLLLRLGLRAVLVEQLECLGGRVAVECVLELRDGRGNLQSQVEDLLLALQTDVLWPPVWRKRWLVKVSAVAKGRGFVLPLKGTGNILHHARQIARGLDVLTDTEVA